MGIFSKKGICNICLVNEGKQIKDGFVCKDCWEKCGAFVIPSGQLREMATVSQVQKRIEQNNRFQKIQEEREQVFNPTTIIGDNLMVDELNKLWCAGKRVLKVKRTGAIYHLDELVDYEIEEDENIINKTGLGRAVAGGVLFGGVGAIVGGVTGGRKSKTECTKLNIIIDVRGAPNKVIMQFLPSKTKKSSFLYKGACELVTSITNYLDEHIAPLENNDNQEISQASNLDQIVKLKKLLDMGALTQEEFDLKKKELLGL